MNNWLVHLTRGLISLVRDYHGDNNLKLILVLVYFGSIGLVDCKTGEPEMPCFILISPQNITFWVFV